MSIERIWKDGDEIYCLDDEGNVCRVNAGWWNGCQVCGGYQDEIDYIQQELGVVEACRFAVELLGTRAGYVCEECREEEEEVNGEHHRDSWGGQGAPRKAAENR